MHSETQLRADRTEDASRVCRMIRWFGVQSDAEHELVRRLNGGWSGSLRDCGGIWQVDVVRPIRESI